MYRQAKRSSANTAFARPVRSGQSALQRAANNSPRLASLKALQAMAVQPVQPVQRMEEDELQGKFIQRMEDEELMQGKAIQRMEEDELQGKFIQRMEDEELMQGKAIQRVETPKTNNTGLPDNLKSGIENLSGMSMDGVKVHRNSDKPAAVQAHAYAQGTDIHLGPGQEQHLPHEAWHVVQQAQGRVKPTMQLQGVAVNDDAGLEAEADVMGAKALQTKPSNDSANSPTKVAGNSRANEDSIQRLKVSDDHIRADMRHQKARKLFHEDTFDDVETRLGTTIAAATNANLEAEISNSRAANQLDYSVLSQQKVSSEKQMTNFLNTNLDDEHMYVLDGSDLHVAIRADGKKLPHPTLVGGDPDVTCAGTLEWGINGSVLVTSESGHFRPPSEGPGKKFVAKMMARTEKSSFKKRVKGKKRN